MPSVHVPDESLELRPAAAPPVVRATPTGARDGPGRAARRSRARRADVLADGALLAAHRLELTFGFDPRTVPASASHPQPP